MDMIFVLMFILGGMSIVFLSYSVLSLLISLEFLVFILFSLLLFLNYSDSVIELISFMVFGTSESVLGLILMLMKVNMSGDDSVFDSEV